MGYEAIVVDNFGGLQTNYRANVPGRCTAASTDYVVAKDGSHVRTRLGFDNYTSSAAAGAYDDLYAHSSTIMLARRGTTLAAINTSGAEATTTTVSNAAGIRTTRFGTPSASYSYIADSSTALIRYDGTNFSAGTTSATVDGVSGRAMPKGNHLTVTGSSNRLVVAGTASSGGPHGVTSGGSYVWFSDPGSGETWTTTNYVQLDPGDGEVIIGCCTWRDQVFVFKPSTLYIFYSETTDSAGNPIFNYRSVQLGPRAQAQTATTNVMCSPAPEGVYYAGFDGVWVTTGDVPVSVSDDALGTTEYDPSPISGVTSDTFKTGLGIHYHLGRLYLPKSSGTGVYVYDIAAGAWMHWSAAVKNFATRLGSEPRLLSGTYATNHIVDWSNSGETFTDDDGTAIGTRTYQTVWWDLGLPGEKTVREVELWGGGTVTVKLYSDFVASGGTSSSVNLGASNSAVTSTRGFHRVAVRGNYFALDISAAAYFRIDRIIFHLRDAKDIGAKSS